MSVTPPDAGAGGRTTVSRTGGVRGRLLLGAALVLLAAGGVGVIAAELVTAPTPPPRPAANQRPSTAPPSPSPSAPPPLSLPYSVPTRIDINRIGVHAPMVRTGVDGAGDVQVPPLDQPHLTGWYDRGPTPGQLGASVILGHVDSWRTGSAVFFYLGSLHRGDTVTVTRADGQVAVFRVDGVGQYDKQHFPTAAVYGSATGAGLRLITCGGTFNTADRQYESNVVVFATLVSAHRQTPDEAAVPLTTWLPDRPDLHPSPSPSTPPHGRTPPARRPGPRR